MTLCSFRSSRHLEVLFGYNHTLKVHGEPEVIAAKQQGDTHELWCRYYYPVGGGAPVQMLGPMDEAENALTGQQPQPLLMPSSTPPQQQVVNALSMVDAGGREAGVGRDIIVPLCERTAGKSCDSTSSSACLKAI